MPLASTQPPQNRGSEDKGSRKNHNAKAPIILGGHSIHRAQSAAYVSRRIAELTRNGDLMAETLIKILTTEATSPAGRRVQVAAAEVLYDRMSGKAPQLVEHQVGPAPTIEMARKLRAMTDDELLIASRLDVVEKDESVIDAEGEYRPDEPDTMAIPDEP